MENAGIGPDAPFDSRLAEFVATFGSVLTVFGCIANAPDAVPFAVGRYITSAYWFTASTSIDDHSIDDPSNYRRRPQNYGYHRRP
jgi:hypothetical protein